MKISVRGEFFLEAEAILQPGRPLALLCHPHPAFGGHMHNPLLLALENSLVVRGLSTVRFNFRGVSGSGGSPTGGREEHVDVEAALDWAQSQAEEVVLIGYSFGALMSARAVANGARPKVAVAIALPTSLIVHDPERLRSMGAALATRVPWLFLAGDRDPLCDLSDMRMWAGEVSTARLEVLEGAGHVFDREGERWLCEKVADFASPKR